MLSDMLDRILTTWCHMQTRREKLSVYKVQPMVRQYNSIELQRWNGSGARMSPPRISELGLAPRFLPWAQHFES